MSRPFRMLAALSALALAAAMLPLAWSSASSAASAVSDDGIYRRLPGFEPAGSRVRVHPDHYTAVRVDTALVRAALRSAPVAGSADATIFAVPTPAGGTERFAVAAHPAHGGRPPPPPTPRSPLGRALAPTTSAPRSPWT